MSDILADTLHRMVQPWLAALAAQGTRQAFLADIIEHPDDDTPRLIFADWLDEQGEPKRAEFIRVQITWDTAPLVYEIRGAAPRAERIFSGGHGFDEIWLKRFLVNHLHTFPSINGMLTFRRGFVHTVRCPCAAWLQHGAAIVRSQPVERVELSDKRPYHYEPTQWAGSPYWRWFLESDDADPLPRLPKEQQIPRSLIHLMCGLDFCSDRWYYGTEAAALDALSAACLAWAKEQP